MNTRKTLAIGLTVILFVGLSSSVWAERLVTKPGFVAVDHVKRKAELQGAGLLQQRCGFGFPVKPPVLTAPIDTSRGADKAYNHVDDYFREAGKTCFAGDHDACRDIRDYALEWAESGKPEMPWTTLAEWRATMTVNMRLTGPMMAALAIAQAEKPLPPDAAEKVLAWLKSKVDEFSHDLRGDGYYDFDTGSVRKAAHNHAVQSSAAAMSYGALAGDDGYFETGIEQWHLTLDSMREDGSLPIETRRGAKALYYHGRTIAGLVMLAERARAQGIDLFRKAPKPGKSIHQPVKFFIDAIEDPKIVFPYAKENRSPGTRKHYTDQYLGGLGSTMGWVASYMREFPGHENTRRLRGLRSSKGNSLVRKAASGVRRAYSSGRSGEWIGVDAACFYSAAK